MPMCGGGLSNIDKEMSNAGRSQFIEYLLSLTLRSPHAADFGRRQFLHFAGRLALGAGVAMGLGKLFAIPTRLPPRP